VRCDEVLHAGSPYCSASRARGRGLDAFLTADRKPFAFSPHGKGKPRPAGDQGAEESAEQRPANGDESDADDLIVLDAAPANRTTLRQNLLRIAATERCVATGAKRLGPRAYDTGR
jgi:hypothetical protein